VADEEQDVRAGGLEPRELRYHVDVVALELLDARGLHLLLGQRGGQALLVRFAPGIVDQDHPRLPGVVQLLRVLQHRLVDQLVDRGDAEHVVVLRTVLRDRRAGGPRIHERQLVLVRDRHDGERDRRIEAADQHRDLLLEIELARGDHALGGDRLVVAAQQLELVGLVTDPQAALRVDLVDRDLQAARDGLARARRLARKRGDQADLDGLLRPGGRRCEQRKNNEQAKHMNLPGWHKLSRTHAMLGLRLRNLARARTGKSYRFGARPAANSPTRCIRSDSTGATPIPRSRGGPTTPGPRAGAWRCISASTSSTSPSVPAWASASARKIRSPTCSTTRGATMATGSGSGAAWIFSPSSACASARW